MILLFNQDDMILSKYRNRYSHFNSSIYANNVIFSVIAVFQSGHLITVNCRYEEMPENNLVIIFVCVEIVLPMRFRSSISTQAKMIARTDHDGFWSLLTNHTKLSFTQ